MEPIDPFIVAEEVRYCENCPLKNQGYVVGLGHVDCPVMVVGAQPSATDAVTGIAFTGGNGSLIREFVSGRGVESYFTHVLKRRVPEARKPTKAECYKCGSHLVAEIVRNRPRVILAMGATVLSFLFGPKHPKVPETHGLPLKLHKFALDITVIPTYDIGYVMRNGGWSSKVGDSMQFDIEDFIAVARRG